MSGISISVPSPTPVPVVSGGTGASTAAGAAANLGVQIKQATTPAAGTALINGTQTLCQWTTPNDGVPHDFRVSAIQNVAVLETGGQVQVAFTDSRGNAATSVLFAGGSGVGDQGQSLERLAAPNTTIQVNQSTALTAGTATVDAQIWGI